MSQQPDYAQTEQQQLADMQEDYQTALARVEAALPSTAAPSIASADQVASAINLIDSDANYFQTTYGPVSTTLQESGLSQLAEQLAQILADLQNARIKYTELYQEITNPMPSTPPAPTFPPSPTDAPGVPLPDPAAQQYADMSETCVHCHYYLGDRYWMLTICPNCQLLLRPSTMPQWTNP
jgi:hypothetical protein